jgi:hypothetical protein
MLFELLFAILGEDVETGNFNKRKITKLARIKRFDSLLWLGFPWVNSLAGWVCELMNK